jgi:hypothetical protein
MQFIQRSFYSLLKILNSRKYITLLLLILTSLVQSQNKKILNITKAKKPPKIDAFANDPAWKNAEEAKDFVQFRPAMGIKEKDHQKTIVKMTYDDNAVYFLAYLHDNPEDILKQFTIRDDFGSADFFIISINPNNDAQNDTEFVVFSSGTQADAIVSPTSNEDFGWNAVWDSAVRIVDDGWIVEVKIPYSALRFSNQEVQTWGIQFHRRLRKENTQYSWNPIDNSKGYVGLYHGEIHGIKNISPPTRLSFYPFTSGLARTYDGVKNTDINIGMDVKYGISENFTLDATLIPDFSQAGFDNVELNLGPFEQQFSEQRQFFTEGVDLFNKGNLFYSRRIGSSPSYYPEIDENFEEVTNFPNNVKVLNAVKISGRTKDGLGVGVFNAITKKTDAIIKNYDTNETRKEIVEPLSNYNILVIDKQFNKNSSVSLINTNVTRNGSFRDANVTAGLFNLIDKSNIYNLQGNIKMSHINDFEYTENGFSGEIEFDEIEGKNRYGLSYSFADEKFDINDMGIQNRNNYSNISAYYRYRIFEPTEKLNNLFINIWANYRNLFNPGTYTGNEVGININATNKNLLSFGGHAEINVGKQYDYWEPRTEGRYFTYKNEFSARGWISTDYNKKFSLDIRSGLFTLFDPERDVFYGYFDISPRIRFNDKFSLRYSLDFNNGNGGRGYVTTLDDNIIFGQRKQQTIENSINANYNFDSFHALNLTFRNYWTTVTYKHDLFVLNEDGSLNSGSGYTVDNIDYDPNVNFNTWNLDFKYSWQFAPGSLLSALYRNSLFKYDEASEETYINSLDTLFDQPIEHIFSLRLVYYIDYNNIKSFLKKKNI